MPNKKLLAILVVFEYTDAMNSVVFMSTQMLAFLLLKKFPSGATHKELSYEMEVLGTEIREKYKRDIGFSGDIELVTHNAVRIKDYSWS